MPPVQRSWATIPYHVVPADDSGALGVNYDETLFGYDVMGRQNRVVSPTGTINRTVFDVRGLSISTWIGTNDSRATDDDPTGGGAAGNNMVQITGMQYDTGSDGGDGNLTTVTQYVDAASARVTSYQYDYRDRRTVTDGEEDFYEELTYDNLDHVIRTDRRDTSGSGNLVARSETKFDDRGRVYQTLRFAVNPATGSIGNSLVDNTWHDAGGNVICSLPSGSQAFSKSLYDGVARPAAVYVGYNAAGVIAPTSVANDVIFQQTEMQYDAASNAIFTTARERWDNATGTGPLNGPTGSEPKSRDSFGATWHDGVGRGVASANYGTNDNLGPPLRPASPPQSSDTVLVSQTRYNERGEAFEMVDPTGMMNRTYADDAGRTVLTIQNFVSSPTLALGGPGSED